MTPDDVKVLFGRRVRQLRQALGVSQEAFAHGVQIDRSYFGSIERGERNVSLENICLIAGGLSVPPAELLRFDSLAEQDSAPAKTTRKRVAPGSTAKPTKRNQSKN